tara:strand:+ start:2339 stop:3565 length:1227 start_codon:yes stop_codon:yes gene_type:complete
MENNLFCSFVHTGEVRQFNSNTEPCCKVKRSTDWRDKPISEYRDYLSQELNSGNKVKDCVSCWKQEEAGQKSYRMQGNEDLTTKEEREWLMDDPNNKLPLRQLEIILANICNFACLMCGPHLSSKWQSKMKSENLFQDDVLYNDYRAHAEVGIQYNSYTDDDLKNLKVLKLMGGEPFYMKETTRLLKRIDELGLAENMVFQTPTNCSVFPSKELTDIILKFRKVHISTSFDGVDELNDFIRYGSDWNTCIDNLKKWIELSKQHKSYNTEVTYGNSLPAEFLVLTSCTITILNINKIVEFYNFFKKLLPSGSIDMYPTSYPSFLSINVLKRKHVMSFIEELKLAESSNQIRRELAKMIEVNLEQRVISTVEKIKLSAYVDNIEKMTGKKLIDVNPYMGNIIKDLVGDMR